MKPELQGIDAKLDRAIEHLNTLDEEARAYAERHSHSVTGHFEPETSTYSFKFAAADPPPLRIGVIVGDFVHNLRSALDHLVWQLVLKAGNTPGTWTRFPMYGNPRAFADHVTTPGQRARANPLLGLEGASAWDAVERLQPYHGRDVHRLLGALHGLSNEDKHRVVLRTAQSIRHPGPESPLDFTYNADVGEIVEHTVRVGRPLQDGTEIVSVRIIPTGPNPEVEMHGELEIGIGYGQSRALHHVMPSLASVVVKIVRDFEQRFF